MIRQKAEVVTFNPDVERILASLVFIITDAEQRGFQPTQYDVVKALFLADRQHLNEFGRPVSFDNYVAMKHGPVPSVAYDILKKEHNTLRKLNLHDLPWKTRNGEGGKIYFHDADASSVGEVLSPSDIKALASANNVIESLSFGQIRKLTHDDPAYIDAWEDDSDRKQFPMSLGLLFEAPDFERAREITDVTKL